MVKKKQELCARFGSAGTYVIVCDMHFVFGMVSLSYNGHRRCRFSIGFCWHKNLLYISFPSSSPMRHIRDISAERQFKIYNVLYKYTLVNVLTVLKFYFTSSLRLFYLIFVKSIRNDGNDCYAQNGNDSKESNRLFHPTNIDTAESKTEGQTKHETRKSSHISMYVIFFFFQSFSSPACEN